MTKNTQAVIMGFVVSVDLDKNEFLLRSLNKIDIKCKFDNTFFDRLQGVVNHYVRVWGLATIERDEIKELDLVGLTILDVERNVKPKFENSDELTEYILTKNAELYRRFELGEN